MALWPPFSSLNSSKSRFSQGQWQVGTLFLPPPEPNSLLILSRKPSTNSQTILLIIAELFHSSSNGWPPIAGYSLKNTHWRTRKLSTISNSKYSEMETDLSMKSVIIRCEPASSFCLIVILRLRTFDIGRQLFVYRRVSNAVATPAAKKFDKPRVRSAENSSVERRCVQQYNVILLGIYLLCISAVRPQQDNC